MSGPVAQLSKKVESSPAIDFGVFHSAGMQWPGIHRRHTLLKAWDQCGPQIRLSARALPAEYQTVVPSSPTLQALRINGACVVLVIRAVRAEVGKVSFQARDLLDRQFVIVFPRLEFHEPTLHYAIYDRALRLAGGQPGHARWNDFQDAVSRQRSPVPAFQRTLNDGAGIALTASDHRHILFKAGDEGWLPQRELGVIRLHAPQATGLQKTRPMEAIGESGHTLIQQ